MRTGWDLRRRFHRAAAALMAVALIPVAVFVATAHPGTAPAAFSVRPATLGAEDLDLPSVDALQRSEASGLFAPFTWNGAAAGGPFVSFAYSEETGTITGYTSVNRSTSQVLLDAIQVEGLTDGATPQVVGPTFTLDALGVSLIAHQEPMALLEIEAASGPRTVVFTFPYNAANLTLSTASTLPRSTLTFDIGGSLGSVILWEGTMTRSGTTVTAVLGAGDYLALRVVPSFVADRAQRAAILDAFASGRLAAEYDLVAMTNGGWLENSAQYQPDLTLSSDGVGFSTAALTMNAVGARDGLILLAFDPRTMPSDAGHRLVVLNNGVPIPETADSLSALDASPGTSGAGSFSLLSMNATVLVVYLPALTASSLQVQSVVAPPTGIDPATELAMVAAVFVVSVAAAVMFRSRRS